MTTHLAGLVRDIPVPARQLCGLTWMNGLLWFSDSELEQILCIDPSLEKIVHTIPCPGVRTGLTAVGQHLLQVVGRERRLREIDPVSGDAIGETENPRPNYELCGLELSGTDLWFGYRDPSILDRRDRTDLRLKFSIPVVEPIAGVTVAGPWVAFAVYETASIHLLAQTSGQTAMVLQVEGQPTGLTWDGKRFWYCDHQNIRLRAVEAPVSVGDS